ncbi:MAG: hypothetical protein BWX77_00088 [Bacteroidetes bacterium ADurb.Bin090]|nr:MAG: hypothetical protein BWX77_00088 [Bacteroidetes bacterium ADurb.Bin090]
MSLHGHHIEQYSGGPGIYRTAEIIRHPGITLHKGIGARRTTPDGKIVKPILGIEALEQTLASECKKNLATLSAYFGNRFYGFTIFHGYSACIFGKENGRTGKMPEFNPSDPSVFNVIQIDGHPTMIFVLGIIGIVGRTQSEVLHARAAYTSGPFKTAHKTSAKFGIQRTTQRSIEQNTVAPHFFNLPFPIDKHIFGFPAYVGRLPAKIVHVHSVYPCLSTRACNTYAVSGLEGMTLNHNGPCSGGDIRAYLLVLACLIVFFPGNTNHGGPVHPGTQKFRLAVHISTAT